ncbi:MAG TPA: bifunctional hydroxymethylpyrimidine kinase/phosphomethylpyrimidine kinase, partial [Clostridia bacterium]|nr:bifunctional hydroxymethylpyrimidine kinase/phosphomethylpyrimidine kinase [Clostridia bacterium]
MNYKNLPRVAAVHDISGFGKCALTIAIPVIPSCGVEVTPIPTAVLSSSTNLAGFTMFDFTPYMRDYIDHWAAMDLKFDALYSGFLGSAGQIDIVKYFAQMFSPPLVIIDPVMGDDGQIYKTYTPQMCNRMRDLVCIADVVTPNLTEACVLTGATYDPNIASQDKLKDICAKIRRLGAKRVIVTGIKRDGMMVNAVLDGDSYY